MYFQVAHVDPTKRNHTLRAAKVRSFLGMCKFLLLIFTSPPYFYVFAEKKQERRARKGVFAKKKQERRGRKGIGQRLTSLPDSYE
jgi:hypothetical protein